MLLLPFSCHCPTSRSDCLPAQTTSMRFDELPLYLIARSSTLARLSFPVFLPSTMLRLTFSLFHHGSPTLLSQGVQLLPFFSSSHCESFLLLPSLAIVRLLALSLDCLSAYTTSMRFDEPALCLLTRSSTPASFFFGWLFRLVFRVDYLYEA